MYSEDIWTQCVRWLEGELPDKDINTWIRPLHPVISRERLLLLAPNRIVLDRVKADFLLPIRRAVKASAGAEAPEIEFAVGAAERPAETESAALRKITDIEEVPSAFTAKLNPQFTLENFIEGKSNAHARAAAQHVVETPGGAYNPLLIYGQSGLGKTHLMHSVGNAVLRRSPRARIAYLGAEQWMNHMVMAIRHGRADEFRSFFRSVDALLIDDIQFFANKERTQEEFFHTFNALIDNRKQIVLTCDRYPKDVDGIDERLKSRFTWGLSVAVEPPELETRVAILLAKAEQARVRLPDDVAFFVAQTSETSKVRWQRCPQPRG
jgi:chromosomal replication initiator protein